MMDKIKRAVKNLRTPQDVSAFALRLAEAVCVRYELQLRALEDGSGGAARVVNYVLAQLTELLLDPNGEAETSPDVEQLHTLLLRRLETRGKRSKAEAFAQWCLRNAAFAGVSSYALATTTRLPLVDSSEVTWSADELFTKVGVETADGSGGASTFRAAPDGAYARYGFRFCRSKDVDESNAGGDFVDVNASMAQVRVAGLLGKAGAQRALPALTPIGTLPADVKREVARLEEAHKAMEKLFDERLGKVEADVKDVKDDVAKICIRQEHIFELLTAHSAAAAPELSVRLPHIDFKSEVKEHGGRYFDGTRLDVKLKFETFLGESGSSRVFWI
jgi:hypothetical protein